MFLLLKPFVSFPISGNRRPPLSDAEILERLEIVSVWHDAPPAQSVDHGDKPRREPLDRLRAEQQGDVLILPTVDKLDSEHRLAVEHGIGHGEVIGEKHRPLHFALLLRLVRAVVAQLRRWRQGADQAGNRDAVKPSMDGGNA